MPLVIHVHPEPDILNNKSAHRIGEILFLREGTKVDPLVDAVGVLEANCALARKALARMHNALVRLFKAFFPKK
jgi:hypothetical protein